MMGSAMDTAYFVLRKDQEIRIGAKPEYVLVADRDPKPEYAPAIPFTSSVAFGSCGDWDVLKSGSTEDTYYNTQYATSVATDEVSTQYTPDSPSVSPIFTRPLHNPKARWTPTVSRYDD